MEIGVFTLPSMEAHLTIPEEKKVPKITVSFAIFTFPNKRTNLNQLSIERESQLRINHKSITSSTTKNTKMSLYFTFAEMSRRKDGMIADKKKSFL